MLKLKYTILQSTIPIPSINPRHMHSEGYSKVKRGNSNHGVILITLVRGGFTAWKLRAFIQWPCTAETPVINCQSLH